MDLGRLLALVFTVSPSPSLLLRVDFPNSSKRCHGQADKLPVVHLSLLSTSKKNAHILLWASDVFCRRA